MDALCSVFDADTLYVSIHDVDTSGVDDDRAWCCLKSSEKHAWTGQAHIAIVSVKISGQA